MTVKEATFQGNEGRRTQESEHTGMKLSEKAQGKD